MVEGSYACGNSQIPPLLGITIGEMLNRIAAAHPESDALVSVHQNIRWTYAEFLERVDTLARALMALDVERGGDRVAIWALNYAEWVLTQFATAKIGAIMVNINPAYRTYEFDYAMKQSEVQTLLIQGGRFKTSDYVGMFYESCPEAFEAKPGRINSDKFPFLKNVVFLGDIPYNGMYTWDDLMAKADLISPPGELREREASLDFDDAVNIQYTSGTTGFPKGVVLTHHNVLNNGFIIGEGGMKFTHEDRLCIPVPFYHCFGMVLSNMAAVTHGTAMVLPAPVFNAESVLKTVQDEKCTALHGGVPTMFIAELAHPDFPKYRLDTLRTGIMAGSPCPTEVMREVNRKMNMSEIVIVYGQTETSPGVTMTTTADPPLERRVSTVGKPFPPTPRSRSSTRTRRGSSPPAGDRRDMRPGLLRDAVLLQQPERHPGDDRRERLEPHRRSRDDGRGGLRQDRRPPEGYGDPRRGGEHLPREIEEFLHTHPKLPTPT